jgi:spore germination protein GerM
MFRKLWPLIAVLFFVLLAGCVPALPPQTVQPTQTTRSITQPPSPVPTTPSIPQVNIYLIAIGDNGNTGKAVGCSDSLVPVPTQIQPGEQPIKAALEALFSIHDQFVGSSGLYNALYQSQLQVDQVNVDANGVADVRLSGTYQLGGECDDPRFKAQIEETALQFPQVKQANIFINNKPLDEILSERGTAPATETPPTALENVQVFLIAVGDNGASGKQIGCGDSVVPVQVQIPSTSDPAEALKSALQNLITAGDRYASGAGLYNVFKQSNLQVESVSLENGKALVQLTGSLNLGGECDNPRVVAQLQETALQFPEVSEVQYNLNGKPLEDVLSLK